MSDPQSSVRTSPFRGVGASMAVATDGTYATRLENRSQLLVRESARTKEEIFRTRRSLTRMQEDLRREMLLIRTELEHLRTESDRTAHRVEIMVDEFRRLARANDFARLQERVDAWAPQDRITKEQFLRMLKDAHS